MDLLSQANLKRLEDVFPKTQSNNFLAGRLKEIAETQRSLELGNLIYSRSENNIYA